MKNNKTLLYIGVGAFVLLFFGGMFYMISKMSAAPDTPPAGNPNGAAAVGGLSYNSKGLAIANTIFGGIGMTSNSILDWFKTFKGTNLDPNDPADNG